MSCCCPPTATKDDKASKSKKGIKRNPNDLLDMQKNPDGVNNK